MNLSAGKIYRACRAMTKLKSYDLLSKAEIPDSSLLGHLPKEFPCVLPGVHD